MILNSMQDDTEDGLAILAFKVQALQFDLNRDLKYISMKDQVIRGRTLIVAAHQAGLIGRRPPVDHDESNVVIIGAGIAGISAALTVCELGLKATVIEPAPAPFPLLGQGSDRLFSATVYDWPHQHAGSHAFPHLPTLRDAATLASLQPCSVLRFPKQPATAGAIRQDMLAQLAVYQSTYGDALNIHTSHEVRRMQDVTANAPDRRVSTKYYDAKGEKHLEESEIVVFAMGFGLDKSNQQTLAGKEFFSYASLQADLAKAIAGGGLVKITGAGDGGLQEALRFVLNDVFHDLHHAVTLLEQQLKTHGGAWADWRTTLQTAEDHAAKSLMWGYKDEIVYSELNVIYRNVIDQMLAMHLATIEAWAGTVLRAVPLRVELVDHSTFSKRVYALNRFLVMLIGSLAPGPSLATLARVSPAQAGLSPDVELVRSGFASTAPAEKIGTADEKDLLCRIAFRAIPMNLDTVV